MRWVNHDRAKSAVYTVWVLQENKHWCNIQLLVLEMKKKVFLDGILHTLFQPYRVLAKFSWWGRVLDYACCMDFDSSRTSRETIHWAGDRLICDDPKLFGITKENGSCVFHTEWVRYWLLLTVKVCRSSAVQIHLVATFIFVAETYFTRPRVALHRTVSETHWREYNADFYAKLACNLWERKPPLSLSHLWYHKHRKTSL